MLHDSVQAFQILQISALASLRRSDLVWEVESVLSQGLALKKREKLTKKSDWKRQNVHHVFFLFGVVTPSCAVKYFLKGLLRRREEQHFSSFLLLKNQWGILKTLRSGTKAQETNRIEAKKKKKM